jgi:hypothetical protein
MSVHQPIPMATKCGCCRRRFTIAGDSAHRMSGPTENGKFVAWCRACDPGADLAAGRKSPRPGTDPCIHLEV